MTLPHRFLPDPEALRYHRQHLFQGRQQISHCRLRWNRALDKGLVTSDDPMGASSRSMVACARMGAFTGENVQGDRFGCPQSNISSTVLMLRCRGSGREGCVRGRSDKQPATGLRNAVLLRPR